MRTWQLLRGSTIIGEFEDTKRPGHSLVDLDATWHYLLMTLPHDADGLSIQEFNHGKLRGVHTSPATIERDPKKRGQ